MAKAKDAASSRAAGVKQVTLPVLARQQMHAARSVADQIEKELGKIYVTVGRNINDSITVSKVAEPESPPWRARQLLPPGRLLDELGTEGQPYIRFRSSAPHQDVHDPTGSASSSRDLRGAP